MIAKIAVSAATFAIDKPYSYRIPAGMELEPGVRVAVPFGRSNRRTEGVVLSVEPGPEEKLKAVESRLDEEPLLSQRMLRLAAFMRERYFCSFYDAVRVMLPIGLGFHEKNVFFLTEDRAWQEKPPRRRDAQQILHLLLELGGSASETAIDRAFSPEQPDEALQYLLRKKWIRAQREFHPRTSDKFEQIATLACSPEEALEYAHQRPRSAAQQRAVLELMCGIGSASVKEICYFTGAGSATVKRLAQLGYLSLRQQPVLRCRQITPAQVTGPICLNEEQTAAFESLREQMETLQPGAALLWGVTGSGKTSVYLKLIGHALSMGKSAMLLVPEIALTPQLLGLLAGHFGDLVAVLHSSLPPAERNDQWKRIRAGVARVVVGTRSAVFAPCRDPALIILDEEQEHTYKSECSPRYTAKEIALWRGAKEGALVLFGSATPSVETMYQAKSGHFRLYELKNRYGGRSLPAVTMVDMRQELREGNGGALSIPLRLAMTDAAAHDRQTILFLNRRGNSRSLVCVDCAKAPECPRCSERLTYHSANGRMMCHYCGFSQPVPDRCPVCGGPLKQVGVGTQKVQQELQQLLPELEVVRMDTDTVTATNTHEQILERFQRENIPVLLGTQMVAKGLNLPNVTLVGVLDADMSLYAESYLAAENTFNMLTQVVGRAGRGSYPGQALVQTLVPEHPVLQLAARQDYAGFYALELEMRRVQQCPPFGDLAQITFSGREEAQVLHGAVKLRDSLISLLRTPPYTSEICTVLGPAPCPVPKINYNFRYRLTLRCHMTRQLRQLLAHLLRQFAADRENRAVSAFADVNGFD